MSDRDDDQAYGTADASAPVTRVDFERAVRSLNLNDLELRDELLQLAAQVVALTGELARRLDGVDPDPATTVGAGVASALGGVLKQIRATDERLPQRVALDLGLEDKYAVTPTEVPCAELIPICGARCCKLTFALSTADLDEGVIRWDYGQPYLIRQRASDRYCVHNDPASRGCSVHAVRPRICRTYDCRDDKRIWEDFDQRIVAPFPEAMREADPRTGGTFDLFERARRRGLAMRLESVAVMARPADAGPQRGPAPTKPG